MVWRAQVVQQQEAGASSYARTARHAARRHAPSGPAHGRRAGTFSWAGGASMRCGRAAAGGRCGSSGESSHRPTPPQAGRQQAVRRRHCEPAREGLARRRGRPRRCRGAGRHGGKSEGSWIIHSTKPPRGPARPARRARTAPPRTGRPGRYRVVIRPFESPTATASATACTAFPAPMDLVSRCPARSAAGPWPPAGAGAARRWRWWRLRCSRARRLGADAPRAASRRWCAPARQPADAVRPTAELRAAPAARTIPTTNAARCRASRRRRDPGATDYDTVIEGNAVLRRGDTVIARATGWSTTSPTTWPRRRATCASTAPATSSPGRARAAGRCHGGFFERPRYRLLKQRRHRRCRARRLHRRQARW